MRFSLFLITIKVVTACKEEVEEAEMNEIYTLWPHTGGASSRWSVSTGQNINEETQGMTSIWLCFLIPRRPFCSAAGPGRSDLPDVNFERPRSNADISSTSADQTLDSGPRSVTTDTESNQQFDEQPEEPRVIGDFDCSSNALWTLFRDEAKSHDDSRINTLKDDMESALIFVRS